MVFLEAAFLAGKALGDCSLLPWAQEEEPPPCSPISPVSDTRLENQQGFVEAEICWVRVWQGAITINKPSAPEGCQEAQLPHPPQKASKSLGSLSGSRTKAC